MGCFTKTFLVMYIAKWLLLNFIFLDSVCSLKKGKGNLKYSLPQTKKGAFYMLCSFKIGLRPAKNCHFDVPGPRRAIFEVRDL